MKRAKVWYLSKVLWFNALAGAFAFAATFWDRVAAMLPPEHGLIGGMIVAAVNVGLRFITTDPISMRQIEDRVDQ